MRLRQILIITFFTFSTVILAQSEWQLPVENKQATSVIDSLNTAKASENPDARYLSGAVPTDEKGDVVFRMTVENTLSAEENYEHCLSHIALLTKQEPSLNGSRLLLVNEKQHIIVAHFEEWMIFRSSLFELDRARFIYMLMAECSDNSIVYTISRLSYTYEGNSRREKETYKAEDWITDSVALNKQHTKLRRGSAKFRRKTIDRVNSIFQNLKAN